MATSSVALAPIAQLIQLPCTVCGQHAVTLNPPAMPPKAQKQLTRVLDLADSFFGAFGDVELPELLPDRHPLASFAPESVAQFLGVVHPACAAARIAAVNESSLDQADGHQS